VDTDESATAHTDLVPGEKGVLQPDDIAELKTVLDRLQAASGRIAVDLHTIPEEKEGVKQWGEFFKDAGPTITGVLSIGVALLVFFLGNSINRKQVDINEKQVSLIEQQTKSRKEEVELEGKKLQLAELEQKLKNAELEAKNASLRTEVIKVLSVKDEKQRTLAAISLAEYGEDALPAVRMALGVADPAIRTGAVKVVSYMFQSGRVERDVLVERLKEYFDAKNPYLHRAVLSCFFSTQSQLSIEEVDWVLTRVRGELADMLPGQYKQEDFDFVKGAYLFAGKSPNRGVVDRGPTDSATELLLEIVTAFEDERTEIGAANTLTNRGLRLEPKSQERSVIVGRLRGYLAKLELSKAKPSLRTVLQGATDVLESAQFNK